MIEDGRGARQSMNQGLRTAALAGLLLAASVSHAAIPDGTVDPAHIKYAGRASPAVPALRSSAAFVLDTTHSSVLYSRRSDVAVPIASITKLMTALVVLEAAQPLDELIEVTAEDRGHGRGAGSPPPPPAPPARRGAPPPPLLGFPHRPAPAPRARSPPPRRPPSAPRQRAAG